MKKDIDRLKQLTVIYSDIHTALNEIGAEVQKLTEMRKGLSEVLNKTRDEEKSLINKLEKSLGKKLSPNDILEIIKMHEQRPVL
jgi:hypothetical protein